MTPTIYLLFNGNCLEAMTHYADILGGKVNSVVRNSDAPDPASRMPGGDDLVMNMAITLGDTMVMASDTPGDMYSQPQGFSVTIAPATLEEFEAAYAGLSKDARVVTMPPGETFWADRFTMFTDRFGTPWMINFAGSKQQGCQETQG